MENLTFIQMVLVYLILFTSFYMVVDRVCKTIEKCGLGKAAAIAGVLNREVNNDGNRIISSTEGSSEQT